MKLRKIKSVAIIALGPSLVNYLGDYFRNKCTRFTDEVWTINHGGYFLNDIDIIVAMDDMRWKQSEEGYEGYIDALVRQKKKILTSKKYPEYSDIIEFPKEALKEYGVVLDRNWLINSCAYAIAYALHRGVKKIFLYGYDFKVRPHIEKIKPGDPEWRRFHLPENLPAYTEPGEANVMYMLGIAHTRGVEINVGRSSTLFDRDIPEYFYGYMKQPIL